MPHERAKILIVEDSPETLLALEALLRRPDYEVVAVSSGAGALKFLLSDDCALILMDVRMPGLDGFETARLVRANERTRPIPIVFLTSGSREEQLVMRGYQAGAVDFLTKPVSPDLLRAKVGAFVELYRAKREIARQEALLQERERDERRRVLAELELRSLRRQQAANDRYRRLVTGITHAIVWTVDPATLDCTFVSPSAEAILGYPPGRWVETPGLWRELIPDHERDRVLDAVRSLTLDGPGVPLRHAFVAASGRLARFQTELCLIPGDDGSPSRVRGFSVDLTELSRAEEELAFLDRAGAELANSLDLAVTADRVAHLPVPTLADWCAVDVQCGVEGEPSATSLAYADASWEEAVGKLARAAALSSGWSGEQAELVSDLATRLDRCADGDPLLDAIRPISMIAVPLRARERALGTLRLFRCGAAAQYGERELRLAAELGRRASQAIDNALLYGEAREAVRVRDEFLSIASHELRTPLTPLSLQTDALSRMVVATFKDGHARSELLRRLATCRRQVDRMTRLVLNLLDVSRLRAGRLDLQVEECDLCDLASDITARFQDDLSRSGRRIELRLDGPVVGRWDRPRLDQVLTNLVSNAVRYGGKEPIAVSLSRTASEAIVTVEDRGAGIDARDLPRIFERFERGESSRSHGGLGLGLYIARRIVEAHGGRLSATSTPGEGSTFRVDLPLEARGEA